MTTTVTNIGSCECCQDSSGSGSGSGSGIDGCCPDMPTTIRATVGSSNQPGLDGTVVTMIYDATDGTWFGSGDISCGSSSGSGSGGGSGSSGAGSTMMISISLSKGSDQEPCYLNWGIADGPYKGVPLPDVICIKNNSYGEQIGPQSCDPLNLYYEGIVNEVDQACDCWDATLELDFTITQ